MMTLLKEYRLESINYTRKVGKLMYVVIYITRIYDKT